MPEKVVQRGANIGEAPIREAGWLSICTVTAGDVGAGLWGGGGMRAGIELARGGLDSPGDEVVPPARSKRRMCSGASSLAPTLEGLGL